MVLVVHESDTLTAPQLGLSAGSSRTAVGQREAAIGALYKRCFANPIEPPHLCAVHFSYVLGQCGSVRHHVSSLEAPGLTGYFRRTLLIKEHPSSSNFLISDSVATCSSSFVTFQRSRTDNRLRRCQLFLADAERLATTGGNSGCRFR